MIQTSEVVRQSVREASKDASQEPPGVLGTMSTNKDISVLVPAHNEERTIRALVEQAARILEATGLNFEIIIINDGSTDATRVRAMEVARNDPTHIRVIELEGCSGKGAALAAGAQSATGEVNVVLDADFEYSPEQLLAVIEPILQGRSDVVFGSRFLGQVEGMSLSHYVGNRILTTSTNWLYDAQLTDVMTGYKAFRRMALEALKLDHSGFAFEVEVTAKALRLGFDISEVPITYRRRTEGRSKIKWSDGIRCFLRLLELKRDQALA